MNSRSNLPRREFLAKAMLGATALVARLGAEPLSPTDTTAVMPAGAREFLRGIIYTRQEVEDWLGRRAFPFAKYDSELGWLLRDAKFPDGVDHSTSVYTYGPLDERVTINYRDRPCRINTYGNSFTQCHQVSDGETWQEVLAAHLQEPVRNFGVGGWSVYQAYLRMRREEPRVPAETIVFNIYDDDHFRNLDAWRNIRVSKHAQFIEPTLPHVVVNVKEGRFEERPNPCPTPDSVYRLSDPQWVEERFRDDFVLQIMLAHRQARTANPDQAYADTMKLAATHGILTRIDSATGLSATADALHRQAAYFASGRIVEKILAFTRARQQRILFVLSYPAQAIERFVQDGLRPDQPFVNFLRAQGVPVVDLLAAHVEEYARARTTLHDYLAQYFIGHYNPRGNFFTAFAIKDALVDLLEPKPCAYSVAAKRTG